MFKYIKIILLAFVFIQLAFAEDVAPEEIPKEPHNPKIDRFVHAFMQANKVPGMTIQMYINGVPHSYYYGFANKEEKKPVDEKTIFELGSLTKIMTSVLLAQEIDYNKMALADSLVKYFQNLPDSFKNVTLQKLATHTSGLPLKVPGTVTNAENLNDYLKEMTDKQFPENEWRYSNVGIGLVGYILENSYERPFDRIYRSHISWPLGMLPVATNIPDKLKTDYAQGYDAENKPVENIGIGPLPAATDLKIVSIDMLKFLGAAIGIPGTPERIFYPMKLTQSMFVRLTDRIQGLGWSIYPFKTYTRQELIKTAKAVSSAPTPVKEIFEKVMYDENAFMDKAGMTQGFRSYIAVIPKENSGIAILANKNINNDDIVQLGREILLTFSREAT